MNSLTPSAKPDVTRINLVIGITINFFFCSTVPILSALYLQSLAEGQVNLPCSPKNTLHVGKYFKMIRVIHNCLNFGQGYVKNLL